MNTNHSSRTTQPRSHPYRLSGGTPLLRHAVRGLPPVQPRAAVHDPAPIDWLYGAIVAGLMFAALLLTGCARVLADAGAPKPHPTDATQVPRYTHCLIVIDRAIPENTAAWRFVIEHEARHCRGWHHDGE
jgi:hypothetical protein